jgi:hypothetical protein
VPSGYPAASGVNVNVDAHRYENLEFLIFVVVLQFL